MTKSQAQPQEFIPIIDSPHFIYIFVGIFLSLCLLTCLALICLVLCLSMRNVTKSFRRRNNAEQNEKTGTRNRQTRMPLVNDYFSRSSKTESSMQMTSVAAI